MRVLITGRNGQVGSALERALPSLAAVVAVDRREMDLQDPSSISACVAARKPDVIVNTAAFTAVDRAEDQRDEAFAVNAAGVGALGSAARDAGALVVHFSTDYVFDGTKAGPYVETDATNPLSVYGSSKLEGERLLAASGCRHFILRTSWVYAPTGRNFVNAILQAAASRPELRVVNDQHGAPTSSDDLACAVRAILAHPKLNTLPSGVYHVCAGGEATWFDFAREILRINGLQTPVIPIASSEFPVKAMRPANSRLDCRKAAAEFSVKLPDWRDGLVAVMRPLQ